MKKLTMAAALLATVQATMPSAAHAAKCADRSLLKDRLSSRFGETLQAVSAPRGNAVIEVYASDLAETWTVLLSLDRGLSCLVASGRGHETLQAYYRPKGAISVRN